MHKSNSLLLLPQPGYRHKTGHARGGACVFTAEARRTQRKRREDLEISKSFSLRFLCALCASAVKKAQTLSAQSILNR